MSKSYVTMEQRVCPVCAKVFDTGAILMDTRLKGTFDKHTCTGFELCEEHKKQKEDGFIFLIEVREEVHSVEDADRTGRICALKRDIAEEIFSTEIKDINFVEVGVIEALEKMADKNSLEPESGETTGG